MKDKVNVDFYLGRRLNEQIGIKELLDSISAAPSLLPWPTEKIILILDEFSKLLLDKKNSLHQRYPDSGLPYIAAWCRKSNITQVLENSFGSIQALDQYNTRVNGIIKSYRAFPRGLAVHWMAGNVPTIGFLSLIQGLLTKNRNIIKAPSSSSDTLLADLLDHLSTVGCDNTYCGKNLTQSIAVIRYDHSRTKVGEALSNQADIRIFWGSDQSVAKLKSLPAKLSSTDIIFSNKTSFMVIDHSTLKTGNLQKIAKQAAIDISVFEQKACASPHTLFLETTEDEDLDTFAHLLLQALGNTLKIIPKRTPSSKESSAILNLRTQYDMFHKAWYSDGLEFTILSDTDMKFGPPVGNRTMFIRKIDNLEKIADILPDNIQTVGILAELSRFDTLTALFAEKGVQRFAKIGTMTHFEIPWDGYFLPQYLVRWVSRQ